jgi:hypothetical protein
MHWPWVSCVHWHVRCVHGDEVNERRGKRSVCLDCGKALPQLPVICSETGEPHLSTRYAGMTEDL